MYEHLKGKRILFLGAIQLLCDAVEIAKEMGMYTIVTDYIPNSPAKKHADKACMVSTTDVDAIVQLCKDEKVDGVFTAYTDSMLPYCREICDRLGFPFYASREQIRHSLDKTVFKQTCKKYGVPLPEDYSHAVSAEGDVIGQIDFPVIVKPIDSSGGRGIRICWNAGELKEAYAYAMSISPGKNVLVEEYVVGDEVSFNYTMADGEVALSCAKDKLICLDHPNITCQVDVLLMPSRHLDEYMQTVHPKVEAMLKGMGATDGVVLFQGIASKKGIKMFELGYRVNGSCDYRHIEAENKINYMQMMLAHAVTGKMEGYALSMNDPYFKEYVLTFKLWAHGGVIGSMTGIEKVLALDNIVLAEFPHRLGDEIIDNCTLAQTVFRSVIKDSSIDNIKRTIKTIQDSVQILDTEGKSMLYDPFDVSRLDLYKNLNK